MSKKFFSVRTWGNVGVVASVALHFWRCGGAFFLWHGESRLSPAIDFLFTPYLILSLLFLSARSKPALTLSSLAFLFFLPDFRLHQERVIRKELRQIPSERTSALPLLESAVARNSESSHLRLLLAELRMAQGHVKEAHSLLENFPREGWPEDLLPRVQHLRYGLYRAGLTSNRFAENMLIP